MLLQLNSIQENFDDVAWLDSLYTKTVERTNKHLSMCDRNQNKRTCRFRRSAVQFWVNIIDTNTNWSLGQECSCHLIYVVQMS